MVLGLIVAAALVAAGIVAYKTWKSGKAVTAAVVVAGVETEVKDAVKAVTPAVEAAVEKAVK